MEMSKCLCLMIVAVIVVAASASPLKKRSSNGESCDDNQNVKQSYPQSQPSQNTINNNQNSVSQTNNKCYTKGNYCCNNNANSTNVNGRGKRHIPSGSPGQPQLFNNRNTNKQHTCNQITSNSSGDQTTGCSTSQSCCQNLNSQNSTVILSCSSTNLGGLNDILSCIID
ncbi:unnamed protein product [Adineta steineri]|uniref:Hydrophobin n=1 Tax=Adineta steineri TaxID=433720 RepID=A0A815KHK2_9BILA|nr:unnamed protein product [Adineta steineri]CAF4232911.1 unnamed protein product [Adineta steineri]